MPGMRPATCHARRLDKYVIKVKVAAVNVKEANEKRI